MLKPKILVVDDDPIWSSLRLRLRANNYEVTTASDGYAAIASAQRERPALIILISAFPSATVSWFWTGCRTATPSLVSVIVLSARDPQTNEERALKAGAAAFFQKPADNEELLNVIRVSLGTGAAQPVAWPS